MRSILLMIATVVLLAGGFFVYWQFQPRETRVGHATDGGPAITPGAPERNDAGTQFGSGEQGWIYSYDKNGRLSSQFRAAQYQPQRNDLVHVRLPEAVFFMGGGQKVQITGKTGNVIVPQSSSAGGLSVGLRTPNRGELQDVTIELFDNATAKEPALVATLPNAAFDNETFRIFTEAYGSAPNRVEADQVPVTVRGADYDFDGRGLVIRWNESARRLQYLEVAHGQRLVVKNPSRMDAIQAPGSRGKTAGLPPAAGALPLLASTDSFDAGEAIKPKSTRPSTRPASKPSDEALPVYRATFHDSVRVVQSDQEIATADTMDVDFLLKSKKKSDSATQPAAAPTGAPAPAPAHVPPAAPATAPAPQAQNAPPATQPATRPAQPVIVYWTGKLIMVPLEGAAAQTDPVKLDPGEAAVRMTAVSSPVVLKQTDSRIECGHMVYRTADESLWLYEVGPFPVRMTDPKGAKVETAAMDYWRQKHLANLHGHSRATVPMDSDAAGAGKPAETLTAEWNDSATLQFKSRDESRDAQRNSAPPTESPGPFAGGGESLAIERARMIGDVRINHPQLKLASRQLDLLFREAAPPPANPADALPAKAVQPPSKSPAPKADLKEMIATGAVKCTLIDDQKKEQNIDTDRLSVETAQGPAGKWYPHLVHADGHVHTFDPDQQMHSGHLTATMLPAAPATKPAQKPTTREAADKIVVQSVLASENVHAILKGGATADAEELHLDTIDGKQQVKLIGAPLATVIDKASTLRGPVIQINPDTQRSLVLGAGTLDAVQGGESGLAPARNPATQKSPATRKKPSTQPVHITWDKQVVVDGKSNTIEIEGPCVVTTRDEKGALNTARGDRVVINLIDDPAAKPATRTAAATRPDASKMNFMEGKKIKDIAFYDNAQVTSVLTLANGLLLRRLHLESKIIGYDLEDKELVVPVAGRMLVEDHEDPAKAKATQPAPKKTPDAENKSADHMRGVIAFKWDNNMSFNETAKHAQMNGNVVIVHEPDKDNSKAFRLDAQTVTADFKDPDKPYEPDPKKQDDGDKQRLELKHLHAEGDVLFAARAAHFSAQTVDYDPATYTLTAHGTDTHPGRILTDQGTASGTFSDLTYNTKTDQIEVHQLQGRMRR